MKAFLSTTYGAFAALIAAVGVLWGGIKTAREIRNWISQILARWREKKSAPEQTLELIQQMKTEQAARDEAQERWMTETTARLDKFEERFDGIDSQVGTLQLEKMMWAYVHYGIELHEISLATRTSLEVMFDQYGQNSTHNHIPQDFKEVIRRAPLKEASDD